MTNVEVIRKNESFNKWFFYLFCSINVILLFSCKASRHSYVHGQKYAPEQLIEDFDIGWKIYQNNHPSYNWYAPEDSVNKRFARARASIKDSMTEPEFRLTLSYALAGIHCGHTAVIPSKGYRKYITSQNEPVFPLHVKVWGEDSMVVLQNMHGDTSPIKRGSIISAIDNIPSGVFITQMKQYISTDGFSDGFKEIQISSSFPGRFKWMYGLRKQYEISYIDSSGQNKTAIIPVFMPPVKDISKKNISDTSSPKIKQPNKAPSPKKNTYGSFKIDTARQLAMLELNSFSHKNIPKLIRSSFKEMARTNIPNLAIDLRLNGGGKIDNSTLLTRYIIDKPFRAADSVSAKDLKLTYPKYVQAAWFYRYFKWALVKKQADGRWHIQHMERKVFKPRKKYHYTGKVFVLTSGNTFSASTLFLSKIYQQPNVDVVGDETGGGARGNSAVMTPKIYLPNTGVQLRLPLFRIISDINIPENGRGILPTVPVSVDSRYILLGIDKKLEEVYQLIESNKTQ